MKNNFMFVISLAALISSAFAIDVNKYGTLGFAGTYILVNKCGTLGFAGTYVLANDIIYSGSAACIDVTAAGVTIDCNGHTIASGVKPGATGIYSNREKTNVKNCNIASFSNGVHLDNAKNGRVENTKIDAGLANGRGLVINNGTNITVQNTSANAKLVGIYISGCGSTVSNSAASGAYGIYLNKACNTSIAKSTITTRAGTGQDAAALAVNASMRGNSVYRNTFVSSSGAADLVLLGIHSDATSFYLNNFTATTGRYIVAYSQAVLDTASDQHAGNIYGNVMDGSVSILGTETSVVYPSLYIGTNGAGYPYGPATSQGKIVAYGVNATDSAPLTPYKTQNGNLIVNASPANGGMVAGTSYNFIVPAIKPVNATANMNYAFAGWTVSGNCTVANAALPSTAVTVNSGTCYATANFTGCGCGNLNVPNYVCNVTQDLYTNGTCFNVQADNVTILCNGHKIIGPTTSNWGTYGVLSSSDGTVVKACNVTGFFIGIGFEGTDGGRITGTTASSYESGIYLNNADGNVISDSVSAASVGFPAMQLAGSNHNNITNITVRYGTGQALGIANSSNNRMAQMNCIAADEALFIQDYSNGNTFSDSIFASSDNSANVIMAANANGNVFRNNTISHGGLSPLDALLLLDGNNADNLFYHNNFTATHGRYIDDSNPAGSNFYNTTINGRPEGNIYANVLSGAVQVQGNASSSGFPALYIGRNGTGFPYSANNSQGKILGSAIDYAPLTPFYFNSSSVPPAPGCVCGMSLTTPNFMCNVTSDLNSTGTCFNVQANNVTIECNGFSIAGNNLSNTYGVYSNQAMTAIKNCQISNFAAGIYFNGATNGTIDNTNATTTKPYSNPDGVGIYLFNGTNHAQITNTNANAQNGIGIYIYQSSNNSIINSTATSNSGVGIELHSSSNNNIINSTGTSNSNGGIDLSSSSNNTISNSKGTSNLNGGIIINSGSNTIIINSTATSNSGVGIIINSGSNNIIINSTATSNYTGILLVSSSNNNIINSTATSNSGSGIWLNSGSNNIISNSTIFSDAGTSIRLEFSSNNIIINSIATSNTNAGISLAQSTGNTIVASSGTSNSFYGIYLESSSYNAVSNSTCASNNSVGMTLSYNSSHNTLSGINATALLGAGVQFANSDYNVITGSRITGNTSGGLLLINAKNNTAANNTISGSGSFAALELYDGTNTGNSFISNTINDAITLARISATSSQNTLYWNNFTEGITYINDANGGNFYNTTINGRPEGNIYANVISGAVQVQGNLTSSGFPQLFIGVNGTGYPYSANTSQGKIQGNVTDYAPLTPYYYLNGSAPQGCVCGNLSTPNYVCNVTQDLMSNGTCFNVQANNVTIQCNGHSITGTNQAGSSGIYSSADQTVVNGCQISGFEKGVLYHGSSNSAITGSGVSATARAISFEGNANDGLVAGTWASASDPNGAGIYAIDSAGTTIDGSAVISPNGPGIQCTYCGNFVISNTNATSNYSYGLDIMGSNDGTIENVFASGVGGIKLRYSHGIAIANSSGAGSYGAGVEFYQVYESNISNTDGTAESGGSGFILKDSWSNNIVNSTGTSSSYGIFLDHANSNTFIGTTGISYGTNPGEYAGFAIHSSSYNTLDKCTGIGNAGSGIFFEGTSTQSGLNTVKNSIGTSNGTAGNGLWMQGNCHENTIVDSFFSSQYRPMFVADSGSNLIRNNTLSSFGAWSDLLSIQSSNNIICLNNFTAAGGYYIASGSANQYNCTYDGKNQGNAYANVLDGTVNVSGAISSSIQGLYIGTNGTGAPYNNLNSLGKVSPGVVDYAPLTPFYFNSTAPMLPEPPETNSTIVNNTETDVVNDTMVGPADRAKPEVDPAGIAIVPKPPAADPAGEANEPQAEEAQPAIGPVEAEIEPEQPITPPPAQESAKASQE